MASIISAGTTSGTSLNLSGDTSGVLQLASNGSTTALTISTAQVVTLANALPIASGGTGATSAGTALSNLGGLAGSTTQLAKAWVNFQGGQPSGTAGTINGSYNVSSITVVGTGAYTINFTNAFANTNYCGLGTAYYDDAASMNVVTWRTISTSSIQMKICYQNGGLTNTTGVNAAFFSS